MLEKIQILTVVLLLAVIAAPALPPPPPAIEALYNSGSYSRAAAILEATVEQSPKDASHYYWLGRCQFESHDFDGSIASWEHAVSLDPNRSEYHDWLGRAYGLKADESSHSNMAAALSFAKKTHHEFQTAVQLDAKNTSAQRDLIAFMANAPPNLGGGEKHAMEQIQALSAIDQAEGTLALADFYAAHKKFDQASEQYQNILKLSPNKIAAYFESADFYRDRGDPEHLQQAVEAAAKLDSADRRLGYYRGVTLVLEKKNPERAEKDLRAYLDTVPDNSELPSHASAYEYLGRLYESEGRAEAAAEQYKAALALDPHNKALRDALKAVQKN